jgi:uncharacterized protein (DUF924 family)
VADFQEVLDFWFGPAGSPEYGRPREVWFKKSAAFDAEIRTRFLDLHRQAAGGRIEAWNAAAESLLALIVVLDQFPRNLYRGSNRAFATDAQALAAAQLAVAGIRPALSPCNAVFLRRSSKRRIFLQRRCWSCSRLGSDPSAGSIDYARRHFEPALRCFSIATRAGALHAGGNRISKAARIGFLGEAVMQFNMNFPRHQLGVPLACRRAAVLPACGRDGMLFLPPQLRVEALDRDGTALTLAGARIATRCIDLENSPGPCPGGSTLSSPTTCIDPWPALLTLAAGRNIHL